MDNNVTLNSLHYFNAHTRNTQDVISTFIARKKELKELEEGILSESAKSIPQHYMIIGSRGMGKSTLLRRLEISLHQEKMKSFIPILFPEEQYNIDRLSKFWLNSLDALADSLETENEHQLTGELDNTIDKLSDIEDENNLSNSAYKTLLDFCGKIKRRPVFLVDNIDILFEGISENEQFALRKLITSNAAPIFIGASTHNPKESQNYDAAFYDAFDNIYLDRLERDEMRDLLVQLADRTGREEIIAEIYEKTGQLDALHNLTGGNPRVAVFLFQLIVNGLSDRIYENLNTLLDVITPLYKSNFEQLSKQAQVIVDALALNWDPCDLDTLSQITRLENNQLSAQLDRLIKAGWIERSSRFSIEKSKVLSKAKNYAVRERFFNIWYIMRRASRRQRGDLKSLTCFLETFYTPQHLEAEKNRIVKLIKESIDADRIIYGLALSKAFHLDSENPLEDQIYKELLEHTDADPEKIARFINPQAIPNSAYVNYMSGETDRWLKRLRSLEADGEREKAESFLKSIIALPDREPDFFLWMKLGDLYAEQDKLDFAKKAYLKSLEIDNEFSWTHFSLGIVEDKLGNKEQAELEFSIAVSLDPDNHNFNSRIAKHYADTDRKELAEEYFLKALQASPHNQYYWVLYGLAFINETDKAQSIYQKGLENNPESDVLIFLLGLSYLEENRPEAEQYLNRAVAMAPGKANYWYTYAKYLAAIDDYESANAAFRKAIELEPNSTRYKDVFVKELLRQEQHFEEAELLQDQILSLAPTAKHFFRASQLAMLNGKFQKAVTSLEKVIELDTKNQFAHAWPIMGALQMLNGEFTKAAATLDEALDRDQNDHMIWDCISHLYHFNIPDYPRSTKAYLKSLELNPDGSLQLLELIAMTISKNNDLEQADAYFQNYSDGVLKKDLDFQYTQAVLAVAKQNFGDAKILWRKILEDLTSKEENDDLITLKMTLAVSQHRGFGRELIELFDLTLASKTYRPLYEALVALELGSEDYLLNVAAEVTDAAREIYKWMSKYNSHENESLDGGPVKMRRKVKKR